MMDSAQFLHTGGQYIRSDNTKIYVEEIGNPQAPAMLMLHGGFGTMGDFNAITPRLAPHFRLIGIDSRGHGKSYLGADGLSYAMLTADLAAVIAALALPRFSLFGFSDGGIAAYRYAAMGDARLHKVITVGASWEMSKDEPCWDMLSGMTGEAWKEMFPASHDAYMRLNPEPDFDRFAEHVIGMWTDLSADGHPGESVRSIDADMLVIRGDNDFLTTLESMARLKARSGKANILNVPFAEHVAFDDAPEIVLAAIGRFMGVDIG